MTRAALRDPRVCRYCGRVRRQVESEAERFIIGDDDRVLVTDTTLVPFRYVCNLEYDFDPPAGTRPSCSGTLIGPRTVLTAGHCINGGDPKRMRVIPGRAGSLEPLPATRAAAFKVFPGFAFGSQTDLGIIHLVDAVGTTVGFWSRQYQTTKTDSIGTSMSSKLPKPAGTLSVNVAGYPLDRPPGEKLRCHNLGQCDITPDTDPARSRLCGASQYRAYDITTSTGNGMLFYNTDTCRGQSGGPVWVKCPPAMGGRVMVGVHNGATSKVNAAVLLRPAVMDFIKANTK